MRQSGVINSQAVQHRRVEIMHTDRVFGDVVAEIISCAIHQTGLRSAAGHPERETTRMMIAAETIFGDFAL